MKKLLTCLLFTILMTSFSMEKVNAQYCTPLVQNCNFERITNVTFGSINNNSACEIYGDFTAQVTNVAQGSTVPISITVISDELDYLYVFIDWNQNEILDDSNEVYIIAENFNTSTTYNANINVPPGATLGNTRMRVIIGYTMSTPNPCEIPVQFGTRWGEVEDYTVNVTAPPVDPIFASTPSSRDFGNTAIGFPKSQVFKIYNSGTGTLTINSSALTGTDLDQFDLTDDNIYPVNLGAGDTMFLTVDFDPTTAGAKTANLTVTDNLSEAINDLPLSGNAIQANYGGNGQSGDNLYFFANSFGTGAPSNPTFNWRSTVGATVLCEDGVALVPLTAGNLDDGRWNVLDLLPVGHSIKFFGTDYADIYINTNGVIGFTATTAPFSVGASLPAGGGPSAAIYPLWMDLNMAYTNIANTVSYEVTADEVIITYYRAAPWTNGGTTGNTPDLYISFQVIIGHSTTPTQNSTIFIQYNWDETGSVFQSAYTANGLSSLPHIIGLQGSNNADQTLTYRNRHNTAFIGPIFGSNLALAFGPDDSALPVDLIAFNANVDRNNVDLSWTTAWEENNARFDVQRRAANTEAQWITVGSVNGHGTVYEEKNYSYTDKNLVTGSYEYRLVQFDYDGNSTADFNLSQTVEVGIPSTFALAQNYPNPFNPTTKIDFQIPVEGLVKLTVFDMSGREVATLVNEALTPGYYTYDFNGSNLSSGAYFYRLVTNNSVITKKMMLVK